LFFTDGYHEGDFFINDMHIETVQYGPGDSKYAHTDDEHVPLNELRTAAEVYKEAAKRLSNRP
jgi:acetylornithine deacetylase/succinyl-diaminopimelate desuccinylase-like protein